MLAHGWQIIPGLWLGQVNHLNFGGPQPYGRSSQVQHLRLRWTFNVTNWWRSWVSLSHWPCTSVYNTVCEAPHCAGLLAAAEICNSKYNKNWNYFKNDKLNETEIILREWNDCNYCQTWEQCHVMQNPRFKVLCTSEGGHQLASFEGEGIEVQVPYFTLPCPRDHGWEA